MSTPFLQQFGTKVCLSIMGSAVLVGVAKAGFQFGQFLASR